MTDKDKKHLAELRDQGYTYQQIAEASGIGLSSVKMFFKRNSTPADDIILVSFLILIVLFHAVVYVVNNRIAKRLEQQLLNCPLPPNSEIIDSASVAGKLQGNGNGMQWFGIILIKSEMNEEELLQWYNSHVDIDKNDEIYVTRQKTSEIFDYSNLRFDHYSSEDCCYQIQIFRNIAIGTESSIWESLLNSDLRGH